MLVSHLRIVNTERLGHAYIRYTIELSEDATILTLKTIDEDELSAYGNLLKTFIKTCEKITNLM
jgi:hypothetical protein